MSSTFYSPCHRSCQILASFSVDLSMCSICAVYPFKHKFQNRKTSKPFQFDISAQLFFG